jgi:hypothetical protein
VAIEPVDIDVGEVLEELDRAIELGLELVEPDLMLTVGIDFLGQLLGRFVRAGMECRVDGGVSAWEPPLEPIRCQGTGDLAKCIEGLRSMMPTPTWNAYPISIWAFPRAVAAEANAQIDEFREDRESWVLWRRIMNLGALYVTVVEDRCSLAFDCENWDLIRAWVEEAIARTGLGAQWD